MISSVFLSFAVVLKVVKKGIERDKGLLTTRNQAISSILELPSVSTDVTVDANQKDWLKLKKKKSESESESKNPFQESKRSLKDGEEEMKTAMPHIYHTRT